MNLEFEITELNRRLSNLVRVGTIEKTDYDSALVRVKIGDILTGWLPWLTHRAGNDISWHAPEVGEQVMVLSPSGELNQGVVLKALYQNNALPPVADVDKHHQAYGNGDYQEHDKKQHKDKVVRQGDVSLELGSLDVMTQQSIELASDGFIRLGAAEESQIICQSTLLIKSNTRLVLKGPSRTIVL